MKSFLEIWLSEAPRLFAQEFSAEVHLVAAEQPPSVASGIGVAVILKGSWAGKFTVLADRDELHTLFVDAKVTESSPDVQRDTELWKGLLHHVAHVVAEGIGDLQVVSIEEESWTLGSPVAAYQLRLGSAVMRIAFADGIRQVTEPAAGGGLLIMDVELEASLRFGSREMSLNAVLELGPGDVVELDRHISDPVDLLVGDKIVARGEVVLVNGNFGFSVIKVAEPEKRLESIRCLF